jgi:transposase
VLGVKVWQRLLGVCKRTVIERVVFDEDADLVVAHVRPRRATKMRCGRCGRRAPGYDRGDVRRGGRRRWRTLDLGPVKAVLEADAPRVECPVHGPTVIQFPWARHGGGHTVAFDDQVAWLATQCSKSAVSELMRVAWETVGSILTRVLADIDDVVDRLDGLRRIGIDEIAYKRGFQYLTVVVDHDSGRLVWAKAGRDDATLEAFFDALDDERAARIVRVSADSADWIERVVRRRCKNAVRCADPFHVVRWATDALDEVRRQAWNAARGGTNQSASVRTRARHPQVHPLKKARYALWKNPDDLTSKQRQQLEWVAKNDPRLHRAYLLKEGLRHVFELGGQEGIEALTSWLWWASHCRIPAFVELAKKVRKHRAAIEASLEYGLSNARTEGINTRIRLITRRAFGFRSAEALIALAMLSLGGYCPDLPGRN